MGIYLPNMEMPKNCGECFACKAELSHEKKIIYVCCFTRKEYGFDGNRMNDDCPLVPVPPHGDLIDAQEEMRLMQSCDYDTYDDYSRAFDMLDNAPTIIPAEEGESER